MKLFLKILRYLLLLGIIIFAVTRLSPHVDDFKNLIALKDHLQYIWILAAVLSQITQYIGDGWLSQLLLQLVNVYIGMKDTFRIAALNVFAAHLLPIGEAGGLAAAYHFYRKLGVDTEKFIFLSICWGVITNGLIFLMLIISILFLPQLPSIIHPKPLMIASSCLILFILIIYIFRKAIFRKIQKIFGKQSWSKHFISLIKNRKEYKKLILQKPQLFLPTIFAGLIYYGSNVATLAFSFLAFGTLPPISLIVFAYAASLIFGRLTLAPAGIGATEATLLLIFVEAHISPSITVGAILIYRLISFWLPIPAGFVSFYSLRKETNQKVTAHDLEEDVIEMFKETSTIRNKKDLKK